MMANTPPTTVVPLKKALKFRSLVVPDSSKKNNTSQGIQDDCFSICTYNVLIQDFVSTERYPTVINTHVVFDRQRRRTMLQQDLQQMKPHTDIFCLEEVCPESFHDFVQALNHPEHDTPGRRRFEGHLVKRQVDKPLFNAMLYNTAKFQLEGHYTVNLHEKGLENLKEFPSDLQEFRDLEFHAICNHFTFCNQKTNKHLLVMMAHLHHNPWHDFIKYAEMSGLLQELSCIHQQIIETTGSKNNDSIYVAFAGDFNVQPSNQVYRLIMGEEPTLQSLQEETMVRPDWLAKRQKWLPLYQQIYQQTQATQTKSLLKQHGVGKFASVYAAYNNDDNDNHNSTTTVRGERGHPRYTNLTDSFTNTIDYIFYDQARLKPLRLLELDTETYEKEEFLPSSIHASDHVILWAEFQCL